MNIRLVGLVLAGVLLTTAGCHKKTVGTGSFAVMGGGGGGAHWGRAAYMEASPQRYIAEHHTLEIIAPESQLQKSWESAIAFCGAIQCEVVSSSITTRTPISPPSGNMLLRVAPQDLNKLLAYFHTLGTIAKHSTEREDKTIQVVDTEAKLKNLTTFRDNLRAMLSKPSATVKDLI